MAADAEDVNEGRDADSPAVGGSETDVNLRDVRFDRLVDAARTGWLDMAKSVIDQGQVDIDQRDELGCTSLFYAALAGHVGIVEALTQAQASVDKGREQDGATPLTAAAMLGHVRIVEILLDAGADPNRKTIGSGMFPLYIASKVGDLAVVNVLLRHRGVNLDARCSEDGTTALFQAAYHGHAEVVEVLIAAGADPWAASARKMLTPLFAACANGHGDVVRLLLTADATGREDINRPITRGVDGAEADGDTPLVVASDRGFDDVVEMLLEAGADPNRASTLDDTFPLLVAAENGHEQTVKLLVAHGARVNRASDHDGWTALYAATAGGHESVVRTLLNANALPSSALSTTAATPLHAAAANGMEHIVRALLVGGAVVDALTHAGESALLLATEGEHVRAVDVLLDFGATLDTARTLDGVTPLVAAVTARNLQLVRLLVSAGAGVNVATVDRGLTPLMIGSESGDARIVSVLLHAKADANVAVRGTGKTALLLAATGGHSRVIELLVDAGADVSWKDATGANAMERAIEAGIGQIVGDLLRPAGDRINTGLRAAPASEFMGVDDEAVPVAAGEVRSGSGLSPAGHAIGEVGDSSETDTGESEGVGSEVHSTELAGRVSSAASNLLPQPTARVGGQPDDKGWSLFKSVAVIVLIAYLLRRVLWSRRTAIASPLPQGTVGSRSRVGRRARGSSRAEIGNGGVGDRSGEARAAKARDDGSRPLLPDTRDLDTIFRRSTMSS